MISAMGPMVVMVVTKLFRRTHRDGRAKKRRRDEFQLFHGYNKFVEESKENRKNKYAYKSNCFPKTIVAFEPIRNIEVTSVCIDIVTAEETQLDIRNIVVETANIMREASN